MTTRTDLEVSTTMIPDSSEALQRYLRLRSRIDRDLHGKLAVDTAAIEQLAAAARACCDRIDAAMARVRENARD